MRAKKPKAPPKKYTPKPFEHHVVTPEERLPDGTHLVTITVPGRAATKKTHQRALKNGIILPSPQFVAYEKHCKPYMEAAWKQAPMDFGISVKLTVTLDNWIMGDEVGYAQSIGDILEKHGVIANDKFIHWVDAGSNMLTVPEPDNPHCVIEIRRHRHPAEIHRDKREAEETAKAARRLAKQAKLTVQIEDEQDDGEPLF